MSETESWVRDLCVAACSHKHEELESMRREHPTAAQESVYAAAALLDVEALRTHLQADPARVHQELAPFGSPLLVLAQVGGDEEARRSGAALLLEAGVDAGLSAPNGRLPLLHWMLDVNFREGMVRELLAHGANPNWRVGRLCETALHVAVRRRRVEPIEPLVAAGVQLDAKTAGGLTAYRHAMRRPFPEVARALAQAGADTTLTRGDEIAAALLNDDNERASELLQEGVDPPARWTAEEQRLLADLSTQGRVEGMKLLLDHGVPVDSRGLDDGTALHGAAWFGQPESARLLIERGATLDLCGDDYDAPPLGWVAHGSRYSGGAAERQEVYVDIARQLLEAGAPLRYEDDPPELVRFQEATEPVREVLRQHGWPG